MTAVDGLTSPGSPLGTLAYMSPEQVRAQDLDARTDLFSFGIVLYEMASGAPPFHGDSVGLIFDAILNRAPAPVGRLNPGLPQELERIVGKCLEKDRELRYQHASEIRADLQHLQRDRQLARFEPGRTVEEQPVLARHRVRWLSLGAAVLVAAAVAGAIYSRRPPTLSDKDTIVLADFANRTGDPVFDDTLRQGLAVQLQQSPFLSVISDERIGKTLAMMQQSPETRLTPEIAQAVCVRTTSAAVLDGSIASMGSQYILALRAKNCSTGDIVADEQAQVARKEDVLGSLSQMATQVRQKLGESVVTIEKYSRAAPGSDDGIFGRVEGVHRRDAGVRVIRRRAGRAAVRACDRDRSGLRGRPCEARDLLQQLRRIGEVAPEYEEGVRVAPSRERRRALLHRGDVRPVRHGQHGPGAGDAGSVGADLSARSHAARITGRFRHEEYRQIRAVDRRSREVTGS